MIIIKYFIKTIKIIINTNFFKFEIDKLRKQNNNDEKKSKIQQPISNLKLFFLYLFFKLFYF